MISPEEFMPSMKQIETPEELERLDAFVKANIESIRSYYRLVTEYIADDFTIVFSTGNPIGRSLINRGFKAAADVANKTKCLASFVPLRDGPSAVWELFNTTKKQGRFWCMVLLDTWMFSYDLPLEGEYDPNHITDETREILKQLEEEETGEGSPSKAVQDP